MSDLVPREPLDNLSSRSAEEITDIIRKLDVAIDLGKFRQAQLLSHMNENHRFTELTNPNTGEGYRTFEDYCEIAVSMAKRTAQYRILVHDKLIVKLQVPPETIEEIGWSKAAIVAQKMDNISAQHWLEEAKARSARELTAMVRDPERDPADRLPLSTMTLRLTDSQMENIEAAIDNASKVCSHRNRSILLDYICLQFNADAVFSAGSSNMDSQLEWFIQRMESTFGVKLRVEE